MADDPAPSTGDTIATQVVVEAAKLNPAGPAVQLVQRRGSSLRDNAPLIISVMTQVGFYGVVFWILRFGIPHDGGGEALTIVLGALTAAYGASWNYFLGSSAGSANKDQIMGRMAPAAVPPVPPKA